MHFCESVRFRFQVRLSALKLIGHTTETGRKLWTAFAQSRQYVIDCWLTRMYVRTVVLRRRPLSVRSSYLNVRLPQLRYNTVRPVYPMIMVRERTTLWIGPKKQQALAIKFQADKAKQTITKEWKIIMIFWWSPSNSQWAHLWLNTKALHYISIFILKVFFRGFPLLLPFFLFL